MLNLETIFFVAERQQDHSRQRPSKGMKNDVTPVTEGPCSTCQYLS
jgi:hypothetical protein